MITAAACKRKGMEVLVFEKVTEYKPFGGPIQLQCNSQGALDSIDPAMAEEVFERGIITGDRVNGLLDGVSGEWFYRFDTRQPCYMNGLPLTLVLSRYDLLDILREGVGNENIMMGTTVESYEHTKDGKVIAKLTDGTTYEVGRMIGCGGDSIEGSYANAWRKRDKVSVRWVRGVYCSVRLFATVTRAETYRSVQDWVPSVSRPKAIFRLLRRRRDNNTTPS